MEPAIDRIGDPLGERNQRQRVGRPADHHRELVAPQPPNRGLFAARLLEPPRDLGQQLVADRVAERIVDHLEANEVEQQQQALAVPRVPQPSLFEHLANHESISESRQRVTPRDLDALGPVARPQPSDI